MKYILCVPVLLFLLLTATAQPVRNKFEEGKKKKYRQVLEQWYDGKLKNRAVSVCELTTIKDSGSYYELVKWVSLVQYIGKDTLVQDSIAASVKPYRIALDSTGRLDLPKIAIPEMTQPIQDFTTFFVAVSPQLGITNLNKPGQVYEVPRLIKGNLASGNLILKGEDCFRVKLKYSSRNRKTATVITSFEPPKDDCLSYYLPGMNMPVVDGNYNNIQMVMPSKDKFNVQWGLEEFSIESKLDRSNGTLLSAIMNNAIHFKMKINCNAAYQECAFEMPFTIVRKLEVRLVE